MNDNFEIDEGIIGVINKAICMYEMGVLTREELPREMLVTVLTALQNAANEYVWRHLKPDASE